jgi:hypothetical protein
VPRLLDRFDEPFIHSNNVISHSAINKMIFEEKYRPRSGGAKLILLSDHYVDDYIEQALEPIAIVFFRPHARMDSFQNDQNYSRSFFETREC